MTPGRRGWTDLFDPGRAEDFFRRHGDGSRPAFASSSDWASDRWDAARAWWCSEVSRASYRRDGRPAFFAAAGLEELRAFEAGSLHAVLVRAAGVSFLAFRGTDEPQDWLVNVRARLVEWSEGGRVHEGFARGLDALWPGIEPALVDLGAPVVAVGHSLGGALATLALARGPLAAAYTFGAPRVGDEAFGRTLRGPMFRVVHGRDPVPCVPPRRWGFRHAGERHDAHASNGWDTGGDSRLDGLARLFSEVDLIAPPAALADHAPVRYSDALQAAAGGGAPPAGRRRRPAAPPPPP
ncbi:MAG: lipase family protein, partial [Planctomycetota bacterium]